MVISENDILQLLQKVKDPEIPTISVVDLGIVTGIEVKSIDEVVVRITPTFTGCPAIDVMRTDIYNAIHDEGVANVTVEVSYDIPWDSNRVTPAGREAILKHGLAPPDPYEGTLALELDVLNNVKCPHCGSRSTVLKSPFGPTLCRSLHYCNACGEAFEGFKPL